MPMSARTSMYPRESTCTGVHSIHIFVYIHIHMLPAYTQAEIAEKCSIHCKPQFKPSGCYVHIPEP